MSDNPSSSEDQPTGNPLDEIRPEADVDALLKDAVDLAADLGGEVGADPAGDTPDSHEESPDSGEQARRTTIDAQLEEIEALLDTASSDVGQDEAEPSAPGEPPSAGAAEADAPVAREDVPEPEVLDTSFSEDALPSFDEPGAGTSPRDELPAETAALGERGDPPAPGGPATAVLTAPGFLLRAAHKALDLLDWADRPSGPIGHRARRVIGWVALGTLFAAVCILVVSKIG